MQEFLKLLEQPWFFLPIGYLFTIAIETPVLCFGLSAEHPMSRRILAGLWLTACTYPIVVLTAPAWLSPGAERIPYLVVAESIAHFGECLLFYLAFGPLRNFWRDMAAVFGANLASFGSGELLYYALGFYDANGWVDR
jgi:hypothetical protein